MLILLKLAILFVVLISPKVTCGESGGKLIITKWTTVHLDQRTTAKVPHYVCVQTN